MDAPRDDMLEQAFQSRFIEPVPACQRRDQRRNNSFQRFRGSRHHLALRNCLFCGVRQHSTSHPCAKSVPAVPEGTMQLKHQFRLLPTLMVTWKPMKKPDSAVWLDRISVRSGWRQRKDCGALNHTPFRQASSLSTVRSRTKRPGVFTARALKTSRAANYCSNKARSMYCPPPVCRVCTAMVFCPGRNARRTASVTRNNS
jgi:hypothetical protein